MRIHKRYGHIISLSITFLILLVYIMGSIPSLKGSLFIAITDFINMLEDKSLDFRFKIRGSIKGDKNIVIAAIDQKSIDNLGRYPWPRRIPAKLVDIFSKSGAKVIGFDITYPSPEENEALRFIRDIKYSYKGSIPSDFLKELNIKEKELDNDRIFANALKNSGNIILGNFFFLDKEEIKHLSIEKLKKKISLIESQKYPIVLEKGGNNVSNREILTAYGVEPNIEILSKTSWGNGFFNITPDRDGTIRWSDLIIKLGSNYYPSLDIQIIRKYLNLKDHEIILKIAKYGVEGIIIKDRTINTDDKGRILINYRGAAKTYNHYSISDIINGNINPGIFKDKIVLVGATAVGIYDLRVTPYESGGYPGVEVHANVIDNIINNDYLVKPGWVSILNLFMIISIGIFLTIFLERIPPLHGFILVALIIISIWFISYYSFKYYGLWITMVYPLILVILIYIGGTTYRFLIEEREKRFIRNTFGRYLSPAIVKELISDPSKLNLGGEERVLTALFSDIAGFSSISEKLKPKELVEILNEYLTEMTDIIIENDGTIDKYEGDAIIAFFGAPLEFKDHAFKASLAALRMQRRLKELREKWKNEGKSLLYMRIGLNTGTMIVGNMGSERRFDYTIMGDSVNLASRLEGVNKVYGTDIIISEVTYNMVDALIDVRELDKIRVVGKMEPITIYEIIGRKEEIDSNKMQILRIFRDGLKSYRDRKWGEAISYFEEILNIDPDDSPSKIYMNRCKEFLSTPPLPDWDGVYMLKEK